MATNTLLQRLEAGETDVMNRLQVEVFLVGEGGTVVVGDAVALDTATAGLTSAERSLFVLPANATTLLNTVGVVLSSAETTGALTAGSKINVCIRGICSAKVVAATGAGAIVRSSGTAGTLAAAVGGDAENYTLVGRTITAEAAGFADVYVHGIHN